ncbi:autotransporter outer membrane beta-barrel domain-containing protein [Streptomyces chartreusis]|uniref:hypothetical protein n=1 Tax=Streptomyces chartreusis TaxID=1969 RepID=UPI003669AE99
MDIGKVLQTLDNRLSKVERSPRLSHAAIDDTSVEVRDSTGSLRGLLGMQADGTTAVNMVNGPPPPQPSAPIVASVLGGVTVSWNGLFADGSTLPLDWARVEVHASILAVYDPIPATLQGTIETAQGATVVVPCDTDVYVRLVARNTSGAASTASDTVGPFGPAAVVADDILDGIVTTVKLADDAVTQAKVAVGAIGSTEISDNAVTTPKIVAGAVQTAQLDAEAVNASKLAAGSVTTAKLDALAVTADKIAANAIIVGKIQAGAVDATALAADAITGKTITGGTITGTVIQTATSGQRITLNETGTHRILIYNSSGTIVGELSALGMGLVGSTGAIMRMDPNSTYPTLRMTNAAGTNEAIINVVEGTAGSADIGINSGQFTASGLDWKWRTFFGNDFAVMERIRTSSPSTNVGGRVALSASSAIVGYKNTSDSTQDNTLTFITGTAQLNGGRLEILPSAAATSALYVNAASGHTGNLLRLLLNAVEKFRVDKDGNVLAAGDVMSTPITTTTGLSAATGFSTNNFYGYKVGKLVVIDLYMNRTGSTITATTGNITPDVAIATLPSGWRPTHSTINGTWDDGTATGGWVVGTDGICTLRTATSDIANNRNLRLHIVFIQD